MPLWLITVDGLALMLHDLLVFDGCPLPFYCLLVLITSTLLLFSVTSLMLLPSVFYGFLSDYYLKVDVPQGFVLGHFSLSAFFLGRLIHSHSFGGPLCLLMTHISSHP